MCVHSIKSVFKELNGVPYQMHVFREMQFVSHCYTVVSCQPIFRHSVYKNSAVYLSGARVRFFLEIRDLGSPTIYLSMPFSSIEKPDMTHFRSLREKFVQYQYVR